MKEVNWKDLEPNITYYIQQRPPQPQFSGKAMGVFEERGYFPVYDSKVEYLKFRDLEEIPNSKPLRLKPESGILPDSTAKGKNAYSSETTKFFLPTKDNIMHKQVVGTLAKKRSSFGDSRISDAIKDFLKKSKSKSKGGRRKTRKHKRR